MGGQINITDIGILQRKIVGQSLRASHYIQRLSCALSLCLLAGCWQEIEYRDPGPTASAPAVDAAPQPAAIAEVESTEVATTESTTTDATTVEATTTPEPEAVGNRYAASTEPEEPSAIEPPPETAPVDAMPPEATGTTPTASETPAIPAATTVETSPVPTSQAKHAAWILGSRLSLAALANDRGIATEDVPKWFEEAQLMAADVKVAVAPLPEKPADTTGEAASKAVIAYLLDQEKAVGAELEKSGDMEMSALFRLAMRTNLLLVLNTPGSKAVDTISKSIEALGPRTGLPPELWQPLLEMLNQQASPAAVRTAVRQMHTDVGRHLARAEL
jgi:hypothetical protein